MKDKRVVFMGTPEFSVPVLLMLIKETNVVGVVTQPDKVVGRKCELSFSPIKKVALANNIKVLQPEKIRINYEEILELKPDIIITCAYGQIIPSSLLDYPEYGCVNVHASLLPKLRGGATIQHAIIDGYKETGITIMYMDKKMDEGDIISQESTLIDDKDTLETLHDRLSQMGSLLLEKTLPSIFEKSNQRVKQDAKEATYGYNIKREDEKLDFNKSRREIFNKVRGLNSWPGAYTILDGKVLKVWQVEIGSDKANLPNGTITNIYKDGIGVSVNDGEIILKEIQLEGKKRMSVSCYLNGLQNKETLINKILGWAMDKIKEIWSNGKYRGIILLVFYFCLFTYIFVVYGGRSEEIILPEKTPTKVHETKITNYEYEYVQDENLIKVIKYNDIVNFKIGENDYYYINNKCYQLIDEKFHEAIDPLKNNYDYLGNINEIKKASKLVKTVNYTDGLIEENYDIDYAEMLKILNVTEELEQSETLNYSIFYEDKKITKITFEKLNLEIRYINFDNISEININYEFYKEGVEKWV